MRKLAVAALLAGTALAAAAPASGTVIIATGTNGTSGAPGGPGGDGQTVKPTAGPSDEELNEARATGGAGGGGGGGFAGLAGGPGGAGGGADATAESAGPLPVGRANSFATGGRGGDAGPPNLGQPGSGSADYAAGGAGGQALATSIIASGLPGGVNQANAKGGNGGRASVSSDGSTVGAGGEGGLASSFLFATDTESASLFGSAIGGAGGAGAGAAGGLAVSGSQFVGGSQINFSHGAFGGRGGTNNEFGNAAGNGGQGGRASANAIYRTSDRGTGTVQASGGFGGASFNGDGGDGGMAQAEVVGIAARHDVRAEAFGGDGGSGTTKRGDGGAGAARIYLEASGAEETKGVAVASGGSGRNGGDANANVRVLGTGTGAATASAAAVAGRGTIAGGNATSSAEAQSGGTQAVADALARGSDGARGEATARASGAAANVARVTADVRNSGAGLNQILTKLEASGPGAVSANALGLSRGAAPSIAGRAARGDVYSAAVALPTDIAALGPDARVAAAAGGGTLLGAGVLGAATSATGSVAFSYFGSSLGEGELWFGFSGIDSDFAEPANFRSLSLTLELQGDELTFERQWQFTDPDSLAAFFSDQVLEIGAFADPSLDVRLGFAFDMVGDGHWGFAYAFGIRTDGPIAAVSEPGSIGLMLAALALFGFASTTASPMRRSDAANPGSFRRPSQSGSTSK